MCGHSTIEVVKYKRVPDFPNYRAGTDGSVWSRRYGNWRKLKQKDLNGRGYKTVDLWKDKKPHRFLVHHIILITFVGPRPGKLDGCHEDRNPSNNRPDNLRWDTHKGNMQDAIKHGTTTKGTRNARNILTIKQVRKIRKLCSKKIYTHKEIGDRFGVDHETIRVIYLRKTWAWLE